MTATLARLVPERARRADLCLADGVGRDEDLAARTDRLMNQPEELQFPSPIRIPNRRPIRGFRDEHVWLEPLNARGPELVVRRQVEVARVEDPLPLAFGADHDRAQHMPSVVQREADVLVHMNRLLDAHRRDPT